MNALKKWIKESREMEKKHPEMYLSFYKDKITFDEKNVWMTQETLDQIRWNCGQYDGTTPTGEYCGKMFLREKYLIWFGIDKENPLTHIKWNSRVVLVRPTNGQGPARQIS